MQKTLFVANVDKTIEDRDLDELFSRYGKVERVKIWRDQETFESRSFWICRDERRDRRRTGHRGP